MIRAAVLSLVLAGPALAQELRPAPDYYTDAVFAVSMAEALAKGCTPLGLDFLAVQARLETLEAQLDADGFDVDTPFDQMIDPTPVFAEMQQAFLAKYPLDGAPEDAVCIAARSEMRDETLIGALLVDGEALAR